MNLLPKFDVDEKRGPGALSNVVFNLKLSKCSLSRGKIKDLKLNNIRIR